MANLMEPSAEQRDKWNAWLEHLPVEHREAARDFPWWKLFLYAELELYGIVLGYVSAGEDLTVMVYFPQLWNRERLTRDMLVHQIALEDLCDADVPPGFTLEELPVKAVYH